MPVAQDCLSYRKLLAFFVPLGFSASLTAITHVIINSTLSRGENAAFIIACYAVAFSLFSILERPIIVFRQTSSVLVKDIHSFRLLNTVFIYVLLVVLVISAAIGYSPIGGWAFVQLFNADENMVQNIGRTFNVISLVFIFSGIRGIYQGVIINHLETKWLTIGVIVRLLIMFVVAYIFVALDLVTSMTGALIFLIGMFIECVISVWKGHYLLKEEGKRKQTNLSKSSILQFYTPLVLYFIIQTVMIPVIYVFIAKTDEIEMSIASFALAFSISQLLLSFFMYTHQLVIQFYKNDRAKMVKFMFFVSVIPSLLLGVLCFTPMGYWFMEVVMGADHQLAQETLTVLSFFILKTLIFPWVDFLNGFLMLQRRTKRMIISQAANLVVVIFSLGLLTYYFSYLNGVIGAIAASLGEVAGLITVLIIVHRMRYIDKRKAEGY